MIGKLEKYWSKFACFVFLSSQLFASNFSGCNIGLSIGGACRSIHLEQIATSQFFFPDASSSAHNLSSHADGKLFDLEPIGELSIGWGRSFQYFYLGFLAAVNFSGGAIEENNSSTFSLSSTETTSLKNQLKIDCNIVEPTVDGKFGFLFCNNLLYGIVGFAYNSIYLKQNLNYYFESNSGAILHLPNNFEKKKQHSLYGLRLGLGFEHLFCDSFSLFMGYTYTYFTKKTAHAEQALSIPFAFRSANGSYQFSSQIQPRRHLFSFGVRYYW